MADVQQQGSALSPLDAPNGTDTGADTGTAARFVATAEGTALAYGSLVLMALLPIFFGALRSVSSSKSKASGPSSSSSSSSHLYPYKQPSWW
ncbi:minor histocompatibility antigen H13 isoform X1 [Tachysurus ichikawai]